MQDNAKRKDSPAIVIISVVTFALALTGAAVLLLIPSVSNVIGSFKDHMVFRGLYGSPWVGLMQYRQIFSDAGFTQSLFATIRHTMLSVAFVFAFSLAAGYLIYAAGRVRWLRHALCTLLLLPLVIPGEVWARAYFSIYTLDTAGDAVLVAAWCSVKYLGLAALLTSACLSRGNRSPLAPLLSSCFAALVVLALFGKFDYSFLRQLPPMLRELAGADDYVFRTSILMMRLGSGSAANTVLGVIRTLLLAAAIWPAALIIRKLFSGGGGGNEAGMKHRLVSLAVVAGAAALAAALYLSAAPSSAGPGARAFAGAPLYVFLALAWALLNTILCYLLAQPVVCMGKKGRIASGAVLLALTALGMLAAPIGEFMLFGNLGAVNTFFAVALSGIASVWGAWALVIAARGMDVSTNTEWYTRMWRPALALFAAQAALRFTDTMPSLLYMSRAAYLNPLLSIGLDKAGAPPAGALAALLAVPVALLLAARTALDEKDNLGMMLP